jgi:hypothetical protein
LIEPKFTKNEIDFLIDEFSIRTDCVKPFKKVKRWNPGTRINRISDSEYCKKIIVDSTATQEIWCHPHVVGEGLEKLALEAALDSAYLIKRLGYVNEADNVVFERVLRAADGYKLQEAFDMFGNKFIEVWLRPRYTTVSKGDHVHKELEIINTNFEKFPSGKKICLIKPDTEAGGMTAEVSLQTTHKVAKEKNSKIETLVLDGAISENGLERIEKVAKSIDIKQILAICRGNLTALSSNNYDMPLYGADLDAWKKTKNIRLLGATVSRNTFERYVTEFIPGSDQPGDWSARQPELFNGIDYEPGGIINHVNNSIIYIRNLKELLPKVPSIQDFIPRYDSMIERELGALERELQNLTVKV